MDSAEFRKRGKEVIDAIADYYDNLDNIPPMASVEPGYLYKLMPHKIPEEPESFEEIQSDLQTKIMPGMTHWQSGNFFGWFPSSSSYPAILGDLYCNMFNVTAFNWICSPAATELETVVMDWLGKLIGLDKRFMAINEDGTEGEGGGVIQSSASEALIVALLAAREMAVQRIKTTEGIDEIDVDALRHKFVAYFSDQTHSSGQKGANIIGCKTHIVETGCDYRLTRASLRSAITKDLNAGLIPFFVCGTFGTTNTTAIDDLPGIADVAAAHDLWYHVDAAYAGAAIACPEFRPLAVGIERADSFNFNPHKWMLVNHDISALWVANSKHLVNALSIQREYLPQVRGSTSFARDYRNWQIPLSRRFQALKLWFVMRMYGATGIRSYIRKHVEQAKWFEEQLVNDGRFEIMAPVIFGLVVFRIKPCMFSSSESVPASRKTVNSANICLTNLINADGRVFLVGTTIKENSALRVAVGSTFGKQENIELLYTVVKELTTRVIEDFN
ncbi:hypothetical protein GGI07_003699 [Coemansia sp. Benny D115]|nr:hypothetical protein GGI07_003699 [Coemansia sp. Benny D115]